MRTELDLDRTPPPREGRRHVGPEGGLPELLDALRWRWRPMLLIAVLFALGSTVYVESLPPEYDGNALLSIAPRPTASDASGNVVRVVGPKYAEYVKARSTIRAVATQLGEDFEELEDATSSNIVTDTGNVTIRVRLGSPERAARAANAFARQTVRFSARDPLLSASIVAPALPDDEVAAPPRRILEAAAIFIGLLIGIVASLLLERGRPRLRSWRDLARTSGYPVLGRIPPLRSLKRRPTSALVDGEASSFFRILRANLEPQIREGAIDFIVVTSPSPGDGKTTIAALLSESFSRLGMKVLLIDADLRRPGLSRMMDADPNPGLSAVLREEATLDEAVRQAWSEGVWVLPTAHDVEAGDLLSRNFADIVEDARERFDLILVDTPPLLSTDDPRTLATMAKGILLVVSAGATNTSVNEAILAVEALNAPLMGIVGNRFKESGAPYYY
jgi:capsular exopolysaccharide synthesis family protein